jgi:serine/threonine-protein kinase
MSDATKPEVRGQKSEDRNQRSEVRGQRPEDLSSLISDLCPLTSDALSPDEARQIDQACDRFEADWKAGRRPRPEEYLGPAGEPARSALLRQLLLLDWDYRRRAGDEPRAADYHARFPGDAAVVEAVGREMVHSPDSTRLLPADAYARPTPFAGARAPELPAEAAAGPGSDPARYEQLHEVGRGGIGVVYRGRDRLLGRELAVKVLREDHRDRPEARRRFVEEARVGSRLQHPAIVPVYELGFFGDRRPYFTMKLVEGHTLAALLRRRTEGGTSPSSSRWPTRWPTPTPTGSSTAT